MFVAICTRVLLVNGPLCRFRVIDLSRARAGPNCVRQFADCGAAGGLLSA